MSIFSYDRDRVKSVLSDYCKRPTMSDTPVALEGLCEAILIGDADKSVEITRCALQAGVDPQELVN